MEGLHSQHFFYHSDGITPIYVLMTVEQFVVIRQVPFYTRLMRNIAILCYDSNPGQAIDFNTFQWFGPRDASEFLAFSEHGIFHMHYNNIGDAQVTLLDDPLEIQIARDLVAAQPPFHQPEENLDVDDHIHLPLVEVDDDPGIEIWPNHNNDRGFAVFIEPAEINGNDFIFNPEIIEGQFLQ